MLIGRAEVSPPSRSAVVDFLSVLVELYCGEYSAERTFVGNIYMYMCLLYTCGVCSVWTSLFHTQ